MAAFCPNKNDPKYIEMVDIFGEDKAMYLWNKNKGKPLSESPTGESSSLLRNLIKLTGSRKLAMIEKSKVYDPEFIKQFGDWINKPEEASNITYAKSKEPLPVYKIVTKSGYNLYQQEPGVDDNVNTITYLSLRDSKGVKSLNEAKTLSLQGGVFKQDGDTIFFNNNVENEVSNIANDYTSQTEGIILQQLISAGFINSNLTRLPVGVPLAGIIDLDKANQLIEQRYNKGTVFVNTRNGVFINEDVLNRIHNVETTDIRGVPLRSSRRGADNRLNGRIERRLDEIGVRVENLDNYKDWYKAEFGETPSGEMIALMTQKLILASDKNAKLESLPKAASYFIVEALWSTDEMIRIRNEFLTESKEYDQKFHTYLQKYEGDILKAQKEVMADIIANWLIKTDSQDPERYKGVSGKIVKVLRYLFDKLKLILRKLGINKNTVPQDVKESLGYLSKSFLDGSLAADLSKVNRPVGSRVKISTLNIGKVGQAVKNAMQALTKRKAELLNEKIGLYNRELRDRWDELYAKYGDGITKLKNEEIPKLSRLIQETEDDDTSEIYEAQLEEIQDYVFSIAPKYLEGRQALKEVRAIDNRIRTMGEQIRDKQYEYGLYVFLVGAEDGNVRSNGALQDSEAAVGIVDRLTTRPQDIESNALVHLTNTFNYYYPVIKDLETAIQFYNWNLDEISEGTRDEVKRSLKASADNLRKVGSFLDNYNRETIKLKLRELNTDNNGNELNPDLDYDYVANEISTDATYASVIFGSAQSSKNDTIGLIVKHVKDVYNNTNRKTVRRINQYVDQNVPLLNALNKNADFKRIKKKLNARTALEVFIERDENSDPTPYFLNKYKINKWRDSKDAAEERIITEIEESLNAKGIPIKIPRGDDPKSRSVRNSILFGEDFFAIDITDKDIEEMGNIRAVIKEQYNKKWGDWYRQNTIPANNWKDILEDKKRSLNAVQFREWQRYNTISYKRGGKVVTYPKGSLVIPSDGRTKTISGRNIKTNDYTNPLYTQINSIPEGKQFMNNRREVRLEALRKLPITMTHSYEILYKLSQLSQTSMDIVFKEKKWLLNIHKKVGEIMTDKVADLFTARVDDTHVYNPGGFLSEEENSTYRPPVRFVKNLEDPKRITRDLIKSDLLFWEMAETYDAHNKNASNYKIAVEMTKRQKFSRDTLGKIYDKMTSIMGQTKDLEISGDKSNTYRILTDFLDSMVRQNTLKPFVQPIPGTGIRLDITKMVSKARAYFRNLNLTMNAPTITVGYVMGRSQRAIEKYMNKFGLIESVGDELEWSKIMTIKHTPFLMKDYGKILQDNKLQNWMRHFSVMEKPEAILHNADKVRVARMLSQFFDYTGWKQQDFFLKVPTSLATARNTRFVDGEWIMGAEFKRRRKSDGKSNEEIKREWKELGKNDQTLWDAFEVKRGEGLVVKEGYQVSEEVMNRYQDLVDVTNSRIDSLPLEADRTGAVYRNWGLQMFSLHRGWLFQFVERRLKAPHFNYMTLRKEEGYYRGALTYMKDYLAPRDLQGNVLSTLKFIGSFGKKGGDFYRGQDKLIKEAVTRVMMDQMVLYMAYGAAMFFNALAADGDDDKWIQQFMAYLSTRWLLEATAFAPKPDNKELADLIQRPIPVTGNPADILTYGIYSLLRFFKLNNEEVDMISRGPYKGKSRAFKNAVRATPWIRGVYETTPVSPVSDKALKGKNQFLKNKVVDPPRASRLILEEADLP